MNHRILFQASITAFILLGSGCSDQSAESNESLQVWRAMVLQAEQMRAEELVNDIQRLKDIKATGDMDTFESEREQVCKKWAKVERLSPTPVDFDYVPEFIPIPEQLPCHGLGGTGGKEDLNETSYDVSSPPADSTATQTTATTKAEEDAWLNEMSRTH